MGVMLADPLLAPKLKGHPIIIVLRIGCKSNALCMHTYALRFTNTHLKRTSEHGGHVVCAHFT